MTQKFPGLTPTPAEAREAIAQRNRERAEYVRLNATSGNPFLAASLGQQAPHVYTPAEAVPEPEPPVPPKAA